MANPKIELNFRGIGEILMGDGTRAALRAPAEKMASRARAGARVDDGSYRDSIHVESDTWHRGQFGYAIERVVAGDERALAEEAKTGNLKRALGR